MTYPLHFTEQDRERIAHDWTAWWADELDLLLSLKELRDIQWIPGEGQPPPSSWLPLLKRIIDAGNLCQLYVSAEDARTIVREL